MVSMIRSELDEWAQHEYNHDEVPNEQFFNLYYRESGSTLLRVLAEADRESLIQVKELLGEHYPDCSSTRLLRLGVRRLRLAPFLLLLILH